MATASRTGPTASERMLNLRHRLEGLPGFTELINSVLVGKAASVDGAWGSARALLASALQPHLRGSLLVVCPRGDDLDALEDDLKLFTSVTVARFPVHEQGARERAVYDDSYVERLRLLKSCLVKELPPILLTSIQALLQPVPHPTELEQCTRRLRRGDVLDSEELIAWFVDRGFSRTPAVEMPGEFSMRGGILDVFSPDAFSPARIEFFGDEITSLRRFDVLSQKSESELDVIDLTLAENLSSGRMHLAAYLPPETCHLLCELPALEEEAGHFLKTLAFPDEAHTYSDVLREACGFPTVSAAGLGFSGGDTILRLPVESVERFSGDLSKVREELDTIGANHEVYLVSASEAEQQRLSEIFAAGQLQVDGRLHYVLGRLDAGFRLVSEKIILLGDGELFHRTELRRTPRRKLGKVVDSFLDLRPGDLVVHVGHGIARYRGLKLLEKAEQVEEHLELEFRGNTKVYVPVSRIELVQKYVGGSKARPTLGKIGGQSWIRQKQAAEAAVEDLAAEMLQLQATRAAQPGIAFSEDSDWQREFEASFPYQETPDQLTAAKAINLDMRRSRPMDRLLCGDVGFGKTELAMRAAFKAVDAGYQVAVLVPTTILAEQHRRTFTERMAEYPFRIVALSRFCSGKEETEILEGLAEGTIDLVIGTHRLAQRDVVFRNLGLIIIDEEQRFGVAVKERLKAMRQTVDVLTMTATPIPRTLHMSLLGLRDIGNLETPPEERISIETRVARWDESLIRQAVLREMNRGGQIFFVHNRVHDLNLIKSQLQRIVPEAAIEIGHGQMPESELERVMLRFVEHRFDMLLSTTIVESGLDIPNANTIFIDNADAFGLADLHQLRGRVGRYKHRGYCYLLADERKPLTNLSAKRLRAIEKFSDLGAGFAIAMRDLEIRGAGNILGSQQSGHIAMVGYELYCQLLERATRRLKNLPDRLQVDVEVDLPGKAFLPRSYVPSIRQKIDIYRRLGRVVNQKELDDLTTELADRFGTLPEVVQRLIRITDLKLRAFAWGVRAIRLEDRFLVFRYRDRARMETLSRLHPGQIRIVDGQSAYLPLKPYTTHPDELLSRAQDVLRLPPPLR